MTKLVSDVRKGAIDLGNLLESMVIYLRFWFLNKG